MEHKIKDENNRTRALQMLLFDSSSVRITSAPKEIQKPIQRYRSMEVNAFSNSST